ncbi:MAG: insulinase family protein [Myxococcota bacterium]
MTPEPIDADVAPVEIALPDPRPYELWAAGDGTEAVLVEDHRVPLVTIQLRIPVGTWSDAFRTLGAEDAWNNLPFDPDGALRARTDALGADLSVWASPLTCTAQVSVLAEDAEAGVDLLRDVLANRDLDRAELRRDARTARLDHDTSEREPRFLLRRLVDDLRWAPTDPRALDTRPPQRLPRRGLDAALDRVLAQPGRQIAFAGDLDRARAEALAGRLALPPVGEALAPPAYGEVRDPAPAPTRWPLPTRPRPT